MKRLLVSMSVMMMLVMSGCGDAHISVVIPIIPAEPPTITLYQFTKNTSTEFVNGSVVFFAPDADIDTITIAVFDSRGFQVARMTTALNLPGAISGAVSFGIDYSSYPADTFSFSIFLTDFNGNPSNQVVDVFRVP